MGAAVPLSQKQLQW